MQVTIDEKKILTEIIEMDGSLHERIKESVRNRIVNDLVEEIESEYISKRWDREEVANNILEDLREKQTELVRQVLKEFYNSYRYKKTDLTILKELKKFIGED